MNKKNEDEKRQFSHNTTTVDLDLTLNDSNDSRALQESGRYYLGSFYPGVYFTPREMDCAKALLKGKTVKEIAHSMGISPRSVEFYLRNMRFKLGVDSKKELFVSIRENTTFEI